MVQCTWRILTLICKSEKTPVHVLCGVRPMCNLWINQAAGIIYIYTSIHIRTNLYLNLLIDASRMLRRPCLQDVEDTQEKF